MRASEQAGVVTLSQPWHGYIPVEISISVTCGVLDIVHVGFVASAMKDTVPVIRGFLSLGTETRNLPLRDGQEKYGIAHTGNRVVGSRYAR